MYSAATPTMPRHLLSAAGLALFLACAAPEPAAATAARGTEHAPRRHPDKALDAAAAQYRAANWGEAFDRMAALADAGHPGAARIALFMHTYGPQMYGRYWRVDPQRAQRWERAAATAQPAGGESGPSRQALPLPARKRDA